MPIPMREVLLDYGAELLGPVPPGRGLCAPPGHCGLSVWIPLHDRLSGSDSGGSGHGLSVSSADPAFGPGQVLRCGGSRLWEDPAGLRGCRGALPAGAVGWGWNPDRPAGEAQVLHLSPSHHFPTGIVTPLAAARPLLEWAEGGEGRYLIEDDYDSEFRLAGRPIPTPNPLTGQGR